jgi:hypothetical protein
MSLSPKDEPLRARRHRDRALERFSELRDPPSPQADALIENRKKKQKQNTHREQQ